MRVLIADDEKGVANALAHFVQNCNHEVVGVVSSGLEAIQAYARLRPDLVLMDYRMPRLNGGTACRNIKAQYPGARVVFVTGCRPDSCPIDSGALSILTKPLSIERLQAVLSSIAQPVPDSSENAILEPSFWTESETRCVA